MARNSRIERLKALERAELDAAVEEWAREALRQRGPADWVARHLDLWAHRFDRLGRWAKALALLVTAGAPLAGAGYKLAKFMWARHVAAAETPATGVPSIALDFWSSGYRSVGPAQHGVSNPPPRRP